MLPCQYLDFLFHMALINFKLKHPDHIIPWGDAPHTNMHWFGLTDGEYWLDLGKATFYEYTNEVLAGVEGNSSNYVDYQIVRLIEDWTSLFESIAEPVPDAFYGIAKSSSYLYRFYGAIQKWLEHAVDVEAEYDRYDKTVEWIYSRTLTAMHLTAGPGISFFRNKDNISIVWNADHVTENNIPIWTAQNGEVEMAYENFVNEIADFGHRFFDAMDTQVRIAVEKDWGSVKVDKKRLVEEQEERRMAFRKKLAVLTGEPAKHTDWEAINVLVTKMLS